MRTLCKSWSVPNINPRLELIKSITALDHGVIFGIEFRPRLGTAVGDMPITTFPASLKVWLPVSWWSIAASQRVAIFSTVDTHLPWFLPPLGALSWLTHVVYVVRRGPEVIEGKLMSTSTNGL